MVLPQIISECHMSAADLIVGYNDLISNKREWNNCFIKKRLYLSSLAVFVDTFWLPYLWSMVYELIYHCLLTNQYTIASF